MNTILDKIFKRAKEKPDSIAVMYKEKGSGRWIEMPWRDLLRQVENLAFALDDLGVQPQDRVGIQAWTRREWTVTDLAVTFLGAVVVPLYPQATPQDMRYILDHAGVRYLFSEDDAQLAKLEEARGELPALTGVASMDPPMKAMEGVTLFSELLARGEKLRESKKGLIEERLKAVAPDDVMTIVYTSGTTGPPKGAVLANGGFEFNSNAIEKALQVKEGERVIAYLPLAHAYERFVQYAALSRGMVYSYAESIEKLAENLKEIRPHIMPGVPRVYEKAYAGIMSKIETGFFLKRMLGEWAVDVGRKVFDASQEGRPVGLLTRLSRDLADRLVFRTIREALGGRLRLAVVAAAPVSPEVCAFFSSLGVPLLEAWGMTETTAPATLNPVDGMRVGTAGPPFPGVDIKLDPDGEVLIKGPNLFKGYYRNDEATRDSFTEDGYFRTGDLGELDDKGYLKIVGRKKDIVINAYGKNIAARNIEDHFMADPLFSACVVFGDNKKYLSAVLSLASEALSAWAAANDRGSAPYTDLVSSPELRALVDSRVKEINATLPRYEQVQKYILSDHEFSVETGEITPTLKVKRKEVIQRYKVGLEALYERD